MLYRFKSKASGDVIMVQTHGEHVLRAMAREASPRGIITVDQLAPALKALQAAISADDAARTPDAADDKPADTHADALSLRRRAWPMVDMLERAIAERVDIVWGV